MKNFNHISGALLITCLVLLSACRKEFDDSVDADVTNPEIEILKPSENEVFAAGDTIEYSIQFSDAGGPGLYEIDFQQSAPVAARMSDIEPVEFKRYTTGNNYGFTHVVDAMYIIPEGAYAGTYTFTVNATDHIGNPADTKTRNIFIENELENVDPEIVFNTPAALSQFTIGDIPTFSASVTDNRKLSEVVVNISQNDADFEPFTFTFTEDMIPNETSLEILQPVPVLESFPRGTYSLTITATDFSGNVAKGVLPFLIHYDEVEDPE